MSHSHDSHSRSETAAPPAPLHHTANDRFKRSFRPILWESIILATVIHFAVLAYWPDVQAENIAFSMDEIEAIELPPEIDIPDAPEEIAQPAVPVVVTEDISPDQTIGVTVPDEFRPGRELPPPPSDTGVDLSAEWDFTPMTVRPEVRNRNEVQDALEREYPSLLRDNGVGGTVRVHIFIDEEGLVRNSLIGESSGHAQLDEAALRVVDVIEFTPALNREERVPVWIALPITFQTD